MPFPINEINLGGTFAFIVTLNNQLFVLKVQPIFGRLFWVKDLGCFLLDEEFRYVTKNGRSEIYFYSQKGCNPISLNGIIDIKKYLEHERKKRLEIRDLALFVDKIRFVEIGKTFIETVKRDIAKMQNEQGEPLTEQEQDELLRGYLKDANFDFTVEKMESLAKPRIGSQILSDHAIAWLNAYYKEDIVSRYYLVMRQLIEQKLKIKESKPVSGWLSGLSEATAKKHIAIVCINNARIDFDFHVKLSMNEVKGHYELKTSKYQIFEHKDAKSRYKFGRQNIFCVMVNTRAKDQIIKAQELRASLPAEPANGKAEPLTMQPEIKRGRGRPVGSKTKRTMEPVIDQAGAA